MMDEAKTKANMAYGWHLRAHDKKATSSLRRSMGNRAIKEQVNELDRSSYIDSHMDLIEQDWDDE